MDALGKKIRLSRIFNKKSGNIFIVALDHPIAHGPIKEILNIRDVLKKVVKEKPEAIVLHKGIAGKLFYEYTGETALVIKLSSFAPCHPAYDVWLTDVEEAIKLGADAVSMGVHVGGDKQPELLRNLGLVVKACGKWGMPVMVHAYPARNAKDEQQRVQDIIYAARTAAELGADIVKTSYTGSSETFKEVVHACPVPIGIAGGIKAGTDKEILQVIHDAIKAGAKGVVMGRNLWRRENIGGMMKDAKRIIHDNTNVE